jgi:hypothetical protein
MSVEDRIADLNTRLDGLGEQLAGRDKEIGRLLAVLVAAREAHEIIQNGLREELADIKVEEAHAYELVQRQGDILRDVANALHGGPLEDGLWSHHDLGTIAQAFRLALDAIYALGKESWAESYKEPMPDDFYFKINFNCGQICGLASKALEAAKR